MDKSLVRSTNEVTFSLTLEHQYENGIVKNKMYSIKMLSLIVLLCFLFNDTIYILVHLPKKEM